MLKMKGLSWMIIYPLNKGGLTMTDVEYIETIKKMSKDELFSEILDHPSYLTDRYYHDFCIAIYDRYNQLTEEKTDEHR